MVQNANRPPPLPAKPLKSKNSVSPIVKYYLVTYNVLSTIGWSYVLITTLVHVFNLTGSSTETSIPRTASSTLTKLFSSLPYLKSSGFAFATNLESNLPPFLQPLYRRTFTTYSKVGIQTAFVQSFALLEVFHVLFGWVRSPLQTTAMQVASRLFLVWGIAEQFEVARTNPLYTSMVFAWSATEIIRYSFYACNLLGYEPYFLLYLRYTTFYVLYPLGAGSEAFLIYATLPHSSPIPGWYSWFQGIWKPTDYIRATLFGIWWPGLYVMYTYMMAQRRKVLGTGASHKLGALPKSKTK